MAGFRYLVAAALLAPFAVRSARRAARAAAGMRATRWRPSGTQVGGAAAVGVLLLAGGNGGVSWSEQSLPSGLAALLVGLRPNRVSSGDLLVRFRGAAWWQIRVVSAAGCTPNLALAGIPHALWPLVAHWSPPTRIPYCSLSTP